MKEKFLVLKNFFQKIHRVCLGKIIGIFAILWEKTKIFLKSGVDFTPPSKQKIVSFVIGWWHWLLGIVFAFLVLYYPAGALLYHRIDLNPAFGIEKQSDKAENQDVQMLKTLSALIQREVDQNAFTPALPFFFPSVLLDNTPAFQTGIVFGIQKVTNALSEANPEIESLKQAADLLTYPVSVWHVHNWKPAVSSVKKYRTAAQLIQEYQENIISKKMTFNHSKTAVELIVSRLAEEIELCVEILDRQIQSGERKILDIKADDIFYEIKGRVYVYYLMLRDLKKDFETAFDNDQSVQKLQTGMAVLKKALYLQPLVVVNASAETQFAPNHLLGMGFYLSQTALDLVQLTKVLKSE